MLQILFHTFECYYPTQSTCLERWIFSVIFHLAVFSPPDITESSSKKNEPRGRSEGQLISVHSGGKALPHPGGLHPLLPCPQSLLGGPAAEDESLWPQYTYNVGSHCNLAMPHITGFLLFFYWRRSNTDQIKSKCVCVKCLMKQFTLK